MIIRWILALYLAVGSSYAAQPEMPLAAKRTRSEPARGSRIPAPEAELGREYFETYRLIEAAERFVREHPEKRALCAGALLNMADLQARSDKKEAIKTYQKAVDAYGSELVPEKNAYCTVANWARFRIARLERDIGNREKALKIFSELMSSADFNTSTSSRIEYLATKQSHLKVAAKVSVRGKGPFRIGSHIPVVASVKNPTREAVTFKCYALIENREKPSYHALAPRVGSGEITLAPGESRDIPMVFTDKDTRGIKTGVYELKAATTGVAFDTDSKSVKIEK